MLVVDQKLSGAVVRLEQFLVDSPRDIRLN